MQTKDFKGQDLRGKSFKNQDLTGADFSGCDLRGVDFSFADLTDAKFCNARMGRLRKVSFSLFFLQIILGIFGCGLTVVISSLLANTVRDNLKSLLIVSNENLIAAALIYALLIATTTLIAINLKRLDYLWWFCILMLIPVVASSIISLSSVFSIGIRAMALALITVKSSTGITNVILLLAITLTLISIFSLIIIGCVALAGTVVGIVNLVGLVAIANAYSKFTIKMANLSSTFAQVQYEMEISPKEFFNFLTGDLVAGALSSIVYVILGIYLGKLAIKQEKSQLLFFRTLPLKMSCWSGTEFAFSNLNQVDFSNTNLKYTRFKNAKFHNCNFHQTQNHHLALTENTPLEPRRVRDLVIDGIITDKNFATLDLRGLDFSHLNLQNFDFSHANLSGANLSHTQLTGATLEGWNIDTETRLDDIDCRYYYYLENGAKKRMPPEGEEYGAGEFTRIFQKIANTIDFIAHNEMELAAIKLSVEQVRVESGNDDIRVQAIEEKDGFIVVKVTVPKTEDRGVLYHEVNVLKQDYEAKIQGLMAEKHIQIGTIETLKEQLKEQRDDFLAAIKEGKIINATNYVEGNMSGGNMAGHDMVISTEAELRKI